MSLIARSACGAARLPFGAHYPAPSGECGW
jgi:hypothetical protein